MYLIEKPRNTNEINHWFKIINLNYILKSFSCCVDECMFGSDFIKSVFNKSIYLKSVFKIIIYQAFLKQTL